MFNWFRKKRNAPAEEAAEQNTPTAEELAKQEEEEALRLIRLEGDVYESLKYYAMRSDLKVIDEKMEALEPQDTAKDNVFKKFFAENIKNPYRRENAAKLSGKKSEVRERIAAFEAEKKAAGADLSLGENAEVLKAAIETLFANDTNGLGRALFGLRLAMDQSVVYEDKDAALEKVSTLLYGDETKLSVLQSDLKDNYVYLSKNGTPLGDSNVLTVGIGAMTALCVLGAPLTMAAGALCGAADSMLAVATGSVFPIFSVLGIGAATYEAATAAFFVLTSVAAGDGITRFVKDEQAKKALSKLSLHDFISLLALKATLVKEAKRTLDREEFKAVMDEHLRAVDDLRSDAEYNWIVEKTDAPIMKEKVLACNSFTERIGIIVGI